MAKYNHNHTKMDKIKEAAILPFKKTPIVIPRDKLELANLKTQKAIKDRKKANIVLIILTLLYIGSLVYIFFGR